MTDVLFQPQEFRPSLINTVYIYIYMYRYVFFLFKGLFPHSSDLGVEFPILKPPSFLENRSPVYVFGLLGGFLALKGNRTNIPDVEIPWKASGNIGVQVGQHVSNPSEDCWLEGLVPSSVALLLQLTLSGTHLVVVAYQPGDARRAVDASSHWGFPCFVCCDDVPRTFNWLGSLWDSSDKASASRIDIF